jgi:hypothetical protein
MGGAKFLHFQFNRHKTGQFPVIKKQIYVEILITDLNTVFFTNEGKVLAEFENEFFQVGKDRTP